MSHVAQAHAEYEKMLGKEVGVSDWITIDQDRIDTFADITLDDQWIHVDPDRARAETPFGGSIAHGFLTLSLASRFTYECFQALPGQVMGLNYGCNKLRFLAPVRAGSRVRGRFTLGSVTRRGATRLLREAELTIEIEGESTSALVAECLALIEFED